MQFKRKYALQNGNRITKRNWQKIVAVSSEPCTNILGVPAIEQAKREHGAYYMKWVLKYESDEISTGYIFREVHANTGISGKHPTPKAAVWSALGFANISVFLED